MGQDQPTVFLRRRLTVLSIGLPLAGLTSSLLAPLAAAEDGLSWYIHRDASASDNHGAWSNVMPTGAESMIRLDLANRAGPVEGETSIRLDMTFGTAPGSWCGIAVASEPGFWGERSGTAFDLTRAKRLIFSARGERGGEGIEVKVAIAGDAPFGDSAPLPFDTGWISLDKGWRRYELPVEGRALGRVITPFVVIANKAHNPTGAMTVYLDDIYFEMAE